MPFIPKEKIDEILQKTNIVDVVGEYIPLHKTGGVYKCLCPFHEDSNPSMTINPDKQIYKCFSCGEGGNAITFIKNYMNTSFPEACKILADKCGVELNVDLNSKQEEIPQEIKRSHALLNDVQEYANYELLSRTHEGAYNYALERLSEETIKEYGVGYIPTQEALLAFLDAKGYSTLEIQDAGVLSQHDQYSFLKERLVFPLKDSSGNVVGFSARTLSDDSGPKYINSRESAVFKKGDILYGYQEGLKAGRIAKEIVLMEGFMDKIAAADHGIKNCVAQMGTALTNKQIALLKATKLPVNLCYDGDTAGMNATIKNYYLLRDAGVDVKATLIPDGMDPDDFLKKNPEGLGSLLQRSGNILEYRLQLPVKINNFEELDTYCVNFMKDLSSLNNPVAEDYYLQSLSTKTNISKESIVKHYEMVANKKGPAKKYQAKKVAGKQPKTEWSSRTKVMINFAVKEKMDYKNEMAKNYDRLIDDKKVMAFNSHKILSRQDILKYYLDQKGKVLETTITMIGDKDMDSIAHGVVETAVDNISKSLGIPRANMDYVAFLHKDTKHPHIHLQCCQKETYLNQYDLKTDLVNSLVKDIGQHINDNIKEVVVEQPVVPKMAI